MTTKFTAFFRFDLLYSAITSMFLLFGLGSDTETFSTPAVILLTSLSLVADFFEVGLAGLIPT